MIRALVMLALAAGCGRLAFDPAHDATSGSDATVDGQGADAALGAIAQRAHITAFNADSGDHFGVGLALSADGTTLAVGAPLESSNATGIDGDGTNNLALDAGAVYVYTRVGAAWMQQAYVKASDTAAGDYFGVSVALSADGNTLAVGAYLDNAGRGSVYMFTRTGSTWTQRARLVASNAGADDRFGDRVALSADGSILAATAYLEDSAATGVGGDETSNAALDSGAAYVFARSGATWTQQAYIKASNTDAGDLFGYSVALSADGTVLAVGAEDEASSATGIDGNQADDSVVEAGAVYVFQRSGTTWTQQAYVKASNTHANALFGVNLGLSADGSTLAVGAMGEASAATGVGGDQTSRTMPSAGAFYVFVRTGATWAQQAYIKASNTNAADLFGSSAALSADGSTLVVGAIGESSGATGINGDQTDNGAPDAGAAYVFVRNGTTWAQTAYVKTSMPMADDELGLRAVLSDAGGTLATAAYQESGLAGAVYVFE